MTNNIKRQHSAEFKTSVVLEILKGEKTVAQISSQYGVHPTQIKRWKDRAVSGIKGFFSDPPDKMLSEKDRLIGELYRQIGQLKVEADWLKKKMGLAG